MGGFILVVAILNLAGGESVRTIGRHWAFGAGLAGGITSTLFGAGGPPYAMYLSRRGLTQEQYRATLGICTIFSITLRVCVFIAAGLLLAWKPWLWALVCLPAVAGNGGQFAGFLAAFGVLFAASGIGNGSTFRMISSLFVAKRQRHADSLPSAQAAAANEGAIEAAAALGFASAIGAYGGFFIPKSVGSSLAITGSASAALVMFIGFYLSCIALTWWAYSRRNAPYPC